MHKHWSFHSTSTVSPEIKYVHTGEAAAAILGSMAGGTAAETSTTLHDYNSSWATLGLTIFNAMQSGTRK